MSWTLRLPVYDIPVSEWRRSIKPVGIADRELAALELLTGRGDSPAAVTMAHAPVKMTGRWAYWPVYGEMK